MRIPALAGTLAAIFAISEYFALKANDWQFDLFETGLAFLVALRTKDLTTQPLAGALSCFWYETVVDLS